jgi:hypothetical protein
LLWGAAGAIAGGMIELILNILPGSDLFLGVDMWPAVLAIPGFLAGVVFSVVLAITERRRRFEDLSLTRFGVWGAVAGALLGILTGIPVIALVPFMLVCGASAAGSLTLARRGRQRELLADADEGGIR